MDLFSGQWAYKNTVLYHNECLNILECMDDASIDMILCDPPYSISACIWDQPLNWKEVWKQLYRVLKPKCAIALHATHPFNYELINTNKIKHAYVWYWNKKFAGNFVQAKRMPLKIIEEVHIFTHDGKTPRYFPQMEKREKPIYKGGNTTPEAIPIRGKKHRLNADPRKRYDEKYPTNLLEFNVRTDRGWHPTPKPIDLAKYLIQTYTQPGDTVLDFCCGTAPSSIACYDLDRRFIGIEKEEKYFEKAKERLLKHVSSDIIITNRD